MLGSLTGNSIMEWHGCLANVGPGITTFNDTKVEPPGSTLPVRAYKE
jgi:hypothetical protein